MSLLFIEPSPSLSVGETFLVSLGICVGLLLVAGLLGRFR